MKPQQKIGGQCAICDANRFELPNGVWVCPGYYASPMHGQWHETYDEKGEHVVKSWEENAREGLESYAGCSLEEYLEAKKKYLNKIGTWV